MEGLKSSAVVTRPQRWSKRRTMVVFPLLESPTISKFGIRGRDGLRSKHVRVSRIC